MKLSPALFPLFLVLVFSAGAETGGKENSAPKLPNLSPAGTEPLWRRAVGGEIIGLPAAQAESVIVVCDGGNLKAYTREGKPLWSYFAGGKLTPFVTRSREGTSYICKITGTLIAVNRAGRELWRRELPAPLNRPAVVGWDGRIFAPTEGALFCFTGAGQLLWRHNMESPLALEPVPDKLGGLVTVQEPGKLLQISPFGAVFSRELKEAPLLALPLKAESFRNQSILLLYKNGTTELHDFESYRPFTQLPGSPLAAASRNGKAAVALSNGEVLLLAGDDGNITGLGKIPIGGERAAMIYDERGIYLFSISGAAGFTEEGKRLWFLQLQGAAAIPALSDEGLLYSGGNDWILYAYQVENRTRPQKQSLYGSAPEGSYGTGNPPPSPWAGYHFRFESRELDRQLGRIAQAIREGRVGEDELAFTACLMEIAGSGLSPSRTSPPPPFAYILHRIEAVRLLSYMGSRETIPFLANLFVREREPLIKAAAAEAIGRIGIDPEGTAFRAFATVISPAVSRENEQVLTAVGAAIGALCRFSGPPLSDSGIKFLAILAGEQQPRTVRRRARQEIEKLWRP
ncbi:MAG: PQQ-binding-like beta-propeller repeat protein [Treponema sp.]|nr:PQQ-binding-like beta-propeller repeat protein [Treponema sp.]